MVVVGSFCIDSTEVTNGQYAAFLTAVASDGGDAGPGDAGANASPAWCSWNGTFVPAANWPPSPGYQSYPVGQVNWCDAYAYCNWAGKRLCGAVGGGPVAFNTTRASVGTDQWYGACSADGGRLYPYGNTFEPKACNGAEQGTNGFTVQVASLPQCVGGLQGIYDMSGNVSEWEDSCSDSLGAGSECSVRGGSYNYGDESDDAGLGPQLRCADLNQLPRSMTYGDVGFRCCADLP